MAVVTSRVATYGQSPLIPTLWLSESDVLRIFITAIALLTAPLTSQAGPRMKVCVLDVGEVDVVFVGYSGDWIGANRFVSEVVFHVGGWIVCDARVPKPWPVCSGFRSETADTSSLVERYVAPLSFRLCQVGVGCGRDRSQFRHDLCLVDSLDLQSFPTLGWPRQHVQLVYGLAS